MKLKNFRFQKKHRWMWLGLAALLLRVLFGIFPALCEYGYSRGFFLGIRWSIDHSLALLPFATVYILFFALVAWAGYGLYKAFEGRKRDRSWPQWRRDSARSFGNFLGGVVFFFLVLWGYNYARIPIETQIGIDARKLHYQELRDEADLIGKACVEARAQIPDTDTFEVAAKHFPKDLETEMHNCLLAVLRDYGYPTPGWVRGRQLYPKGLLYGFNSSGVYMPFTGEGHIEAGLHILQKPFTLAHEMSHGYGFGDEATCNFLGYLACLRSSYPAIRYSGLLSYWRYVYGEVDAKYYFEKSPLIDRGMFNDLSAIYKEMNQYFEFIPGLQEIAYEAYLQMQGVKEGLQSYDRMVLMVVALRRKETGKN